MAGTAIEVASHVFKMQFAAQLGIKYNTFSNHLNSTRPVWSPTLNLYITLSNGLEYWSGTLQGPYLNTQPIQEVDLTSLPHGIIALAADKLTQLDIFTSAAQAAFKLDGKLESSYIFRYINIEYMVNTSLGLVYFVMNPNYVAPTTQFKGGIKGVKLLIYMFDPNLGIYVMFSSKALASEFIWGAKNRAQAFDRYLARTPGKAPLAFKIIYCFITRMIYLTMLKLLVCKSILLLLIMIDIYILAMLSNLWIYILINSRLSMVGLLPEE